MSDKTKIISAILVVFLLAISRLVRHPFNFTPVVAMSIFSGAYLKKKWALAIPLAGMLVSDYFIGFYDWQVMASVYVGVGLAFFVGWVLKSKMNWKNIVVASLVSSAIFFLITNFSVWAFFSWYPHTIRGLVSCFALGLPFFRNSLLGDVVYTGVIFGAYETAFAWRNSRKKIMQNN